MPFERKGVTNPLYSASYARISLTGAEMESFDLLIDGVFERGAARILNSNCQPWAGAEAREEEVDRAVAAAKRAFTIRPGVG